MAEKRLTQFESIDRCLHLGLIRAVPGVQPDKAFGHGGVTLLLVRWTIDDHLDVSDYRL